MEISGKVRLYILIIGTSICAAALIIVSGFVIKNKTENPEHWVLHSYGNNVALYKGDDIVEVYGEIVLDTLPEDDRRLLDNGISFSTKEEAVNAIEDYDG